MARHIDCDRIVALRRTGMTILDIAHTVRCSDRTVAKVLRSVGLNTGQPRFTVPREAIEALWNQELTMREIGERLGCSEATAARIARDYRLPKKITVQKPVVGDPTPDEIERLKAELKQKHIESRRREADDTTRIRLWK